MGRVISVAGHAVFMSSETPTRVKLINRPSGSLIPLILASFSADQSNKIVLFDYPAVTGF